MNRKMEEVNVILDIMRTLGTCIIQAGREGVPSGHLYASMTPPDIGLSEYDSLINILKKAELVEEENYILRWIGPVSTENIK